MESVDAYANELKRLAGLAGFKGDACERLVKLLFVQQIMNIKTIEIKHVIIRARILVTNRLEPVIVANGFRQSGAAKEQSQKIHGGVSRNNQADF